MSRTNRMSSHLLRAAALALAFAASPAQSQTAVTVFEGARLITGDGITIENSAFMVENGRFTAVGRRADMQVPPGATRVDLAGKTVMPTMVDLHGHFGYQNVAQ